MCLLVVSVCDVWCVCREIRTRKKCTSISMACIALLLPRSTGTRWQVRNPHITRVNSPRNIHMYVRVCYMYVHVYVHVCICMYVYVCVCMYVCMY